MLGNTAYVSIPKYSPDFYQPNVGMSVHQIVYFQKVVNVSDMEYFMYPFMFRQFNVYIIVEEPGRMYLPGTLELLTFISKLLVFMGHILANKKSSRKF